MSRYGMLSDDHYVNMNLNTEMELPQTRDGVLHFFEQVKKKYPSMRNFYGRERGEFVLEEDKEPGSYRWVAVEARRISSGYVNPPSWDEAIEQHRAILSQAPYSVSVSPLDCESLNVMMGFDFTYRGNHNQLLMEALGVCPAFEKLATQCDPLRVTKLNSTFSRATFAWRERLRSLRVIGADCPKRKPRKLTHSS